MFRISSFEKNLENATSHLRLEPDWPSILLICDAIRQNDVSAKQAFLAIKKKMTSPNPHTAFYALLVLESIVKNCGAPMHDEISVLENCEMFAGLIEQTQHENVRAKMLELVQTWAYAFRMSDKHQAIKDTMTILKAKGYSFPELKEADAMFTADTAPDWADGKVCHRCRVEFSFTQRKHHCRNCGQIFCAQCSSKQCPLPKFGIEKEVRVCDGCFSQLQKPTTLKPGAENELPAEYLNSSLAQQSQVPNRKSEQELKEEEELQLALALSQSEAEQKNKISTYTSYQSTSSPDTTIPMQLNQQTADETSTDPELAKYLNRSYWENRKTSTITSTNVTAAIHFPASPSAPSPMPQLSNNEIKFVPEDVEIDEFGNNMKSQVEIFVNRMKSNSSRGRSIATDSSVQTLFMNLTSLHSRLLTYIKEMDDKRMWYEQIQDKLAQIKDSRAALDVLRQEHADKLRRIAEEQELQRQLQMAQKLEIMRKKKQEYLQYQRQLALQRIQEQEREMQMRQEQQKAQYLMGQNKFPYLSGQSSPSHQMQNAYDAYGYGAPPSITLPQYSIPGQAITTQSSNPHHSQSLSSAPMPGMYNPSISAISAQVVVGGNLPSNMPMPLGASPHVIQSPPQTLQGTGISKLPEPATFNPNQRQQPPLTQDQTHMGSNIQNISHIIPSNPIGPRSHQISESASQGGIAQMPSQTPSFQAKTVDPSTHMLPSLTSKAANNSTTQVEEITIADEVKTAELISFD